jgi:proline dehydrogenase
MLPDFSNTEIAFKFRSDKELKHAHLLFSLIGNASLTKLGIKLTGLALSWKLPVKSIIKKTLFEQFCGGENLPEAAQTAERIGKYRVNTILDYGVEGKESEADFDKAVPEFINAVKYAASKEHIPFISLKVTGFCRFALLEKINAKEALNAAEKEEWQRVHKRIDAICSEAAKDDIMVLVDAEETWIQEGVNELVEAMMLKYNKKEAVVFNTFQMYSHSTLPYLKYCIETAAKNGYIYGAKLVRGAYMEKERLRAKEKGYEDPIQPNKEATDRDYDAGVLYCLENLKQSALFIGTHNEQSCMKAAQYMLDHKIDLSTRRVYISQLFGMSDNISFNMAHSGYNVAKYLPYGPVKDVAPYLMRRAEENTSVAGQTSRELALIEKEIKRRGI